MNDDNVTTYKGYKIKLTPDDSPESPREWSNLGTMVSWHTRCTIGDYSVGHSRQHKTGTIYFDDPRELAEYCHRQDVFSLPVYLYEHSGQTVKTTPFYDPWDSGQVGFVFVSNDRIREEYSVKRISKQLREKVARILVQEVETYNQWLTGDVWGYEIFEPDNEDLESADSVDSCWGYYGSDYCLKQAQDGVDILIESNQAAAWDKFQQAELSGVISD